MNHPENQTTPLHMLSQVSEHQGLSDLADHLLSLEHLIQYDMSLFQQEILNVIPDHALVEKTARHLLEQGGKYLRPLCVMVAAQMGVANRQSILKLAIAVELIHSATLLHDDVVDVAEKRRGKKTARLIYGNAASIFAGDFLLIEALRLVETASDGRLLTRLFQVIQDMIYAESFQLERRGSIDIHPQNYFKIIEGKTAALFEFALFAGASIGHLSDEECTALSLYGKYLGIAFQLMDDALDFSAQSKEWGKERFIDLKEGKVTYPLLVACQKEPSLLQQIRDYLTSQEEERDMTHIEHFLREAVLRLGGVAETQYLAQGYVAKAQTELSHLPDSNAKIALKVIAEKSLMRHK